MDLNDLLKNIPVADLAKQFGVDEAVVNGALKQAVPGILTGMAVNASSEEGAQKLTMAAQNHSGKKTAITDIDTEDGKKIVKKVLGENETAVVSALSSNAGNSDIAALIPKILPVIAPMIMQFLGGSLGGGQKSSSSSSSGVTDILGSLLGGASGSSGGGITDLLGGILGGGNGSNKGGLGGLLGGLLNGGK